MTRISWFLPVAALLALATVTGCQPDPPDQQAGSSSSPTTTTAAAKPTPTPEPTAKDGTDLSACADGSCEVEVEAGQDVAMPAGMGVKSLKVTRIASDRVEFAGKGSGNGSGGCYGNPPCDFVNHGGAISVTLGKSATAVMNAAGITVVSIGDGTAIISVEVED